MNKKQATQAICNVRSTTQQRALGFVKVLKIDIDFFFDITFILIFMTFTNSSARTLLCCGADIANCLS